MPRAKQNKLYRTFVKGLITEAGYLTYPENASVDELNTVISRKGNRTRRLGVDFEDNHTLIDIGAEDGEAITEFVWRAVDNKAGLHFLALQVGWIIHFFDLDAAPVSDTKKSFTLDLRTYKVAGSNDAEIRNTPVEFAGGKGLMFIVHPKVEPMCIEYDSDTDTISVLPIQIQVRDFDGVYDGLPNDMEPVTLSKEHHYNLMNQGWVTPGTRQNFGSGSSPDQVTVYDPYTGQSHDVDYREGIRPNNFEQEQ